MRGPLTLGLLLAGCQVTSHLPPEAPLAELDEGARRQLCRFTVDVWAGVELACAPHAREFEACVADPPWAACDPPDGRTADVASWEDCVRAAAECRADDASCWHVRCL